MRNIFDQYSQPENRLTHALISSLNEDKKLLSSFIKKFCNNYFSDVGSLKIDQQTLPGTKSLQLSDDKKKPIQDALEDLKKAYETRDLETIQPALDKINEAWKVASEEMYKAQADGQAGAEPAADPVADDQSADVEDVDFEEVK